MNSLLQALRFLTIIPLGRAAKADSEPVPRVIQHSSSDRDNKHEQRSGDTIKGEHVPGATAGRNHTSQLHVKVEYFPAVGLIVGLIIAAAGAFFFHVLPPLVAGACTIVSLVLLTGGLHLDGLADTADGFFSARPREEILRIMRDSRTGAMGVVAVMCVLILKVAAVSALAEGMRTPALVLMPLLGRCSMGLMLHILPAARRDGMAASIRPATNGSLVWSFVVPLAAGLVLLGLNGVLLSLLSLLAIAPLALLAWRKIGGMTGDVLGAACEVVEAAALVTGAAIGFGN